MTKINMDIIQAYKQEKMRENADVEGKQRKASEELQGALGASGINISKVSSLMESIPAHQQTNNDDGFTGLNDLSIGIDRNNPQQNNPNSYDRDEAMYENFNQRFRNITGTPNFNINEQQNYPNQQQFPNGNFQNNGYRHQQPINENTQNAYEYLEKRLGMIFNNNSELKYLLKPIVMEIIAELFSEASIEKQLVKIIKRNKGKQ